MMLSIDIYYRGGAILYNYSYNIIGPNFNSHSSLGARPPVFQHVELKSLERACMHGYQ